MIDQRRAEHKAKRGVKSEGKGYQPEIEHSKLGDAKKKKDKERESKLPPHLQGDAIGKMKKAFASEEKVDEALGAAYAIGGVSNAIAAGAKAWGASQAAKGAIIGGALSGGGAVVGGALNYAASRNKNKKSESKKKKMKEDKAFNFVVDKLRKQYGSGVMTKGDKMPEPSAAQKKKNAAIRAKRAKEDHRDPTEKASDGRYSDRYSNRGSD